MVLFGDDLVHFLDKAPEMRQACFQFAESRILIFGDFLEMRVSC